MAENNRLHETLSACLDGEAGELELRQLLRSMSDDPRGDELRQRWRRYNVVRTTLARELPERKIDVADGVRQALEQEGAFKSSPPRGKGIQSASRFAIAASVAAMAVIGVRTVQFGAEPAAVSESPAVAAQTESPQLQPAINFDFDMPIAARTVGAGGTPMVSAPYAVNGPQVFRVAQPDPATAQDIQLYFDELMLLHAESAATSVNPSMLNLMRMPHQAPRANP